MDYFDRLEADTKALYEIANEARSKGLDVETKSEVPLAKDLAERVEGLVGPEGVAKRIKELEQDITREEVAFEIAAEIASGKFELTKEKARKFLIVFPLNPLNTWLYCKRIIGIVDDKTRLCFWWLFHIFSQYIIHPDLLLILATGIVGR